MSRKAINIQWDTDNDNEVVLPAEIEIPEELTDDEEIGDYLSDSTGFCHFGYELIETPDNYSVTIQNIIDIADSLEWAVHIDEPSEHDPSYGLEFEKYSPAGEDFFFYVRTNEDPEARAEDLVREIWRYANDFDPEEHAQLNLGAKGAPGLFELCEDAKEIAEMLEELADALKELVQGKPVSIADQVVNEECEKHNVSEKAYELGLPTVRELIELLSKLPQDYRVSCCGANCCINLFPEEKVVTIDNEVVE